MSKASNIRFFNTQKLVRKLKNAIHWGKRMSKLEQRLRGKLAMLRTEIADKDTRIEELEGEQKKIRIEAIGWAWAEACNQLDADNDPRELEVSYLISLSKHDLGALPSPTTGEPGEEEPAHVPYANAKSITSKRVRITDRKKGCPTTPTGDDENE